MLGFENKANSLSSRCALLVFPLDISREAEAGNGNGLLAQQQRGQRKNEIMQTFDSYTFLYMRLKVHTSPRSFLILI